MIYTASYFAPQHHHGELISISNSIPKGISVSESLGFFKPSRELLGWWKESRKDEAAWAEYTSRFWALLAERKETILNWIDSLGSRPDRDITLCCWEAEGEYCHRNLVARLLRKHKPDFFGGCDMPQLEIGDNVNWIWHYSYLSVFQPFKIRAIVGDRAYLDWLSFPVKLSELRSTQCPL